MASPTKQATARIEDLFDLHGEDTMHSFVIDLLTDLKLFCGEDAFAEYLESAEGHFQAEVQD